MKKQTLPTNWDLSQLGTKIKDPNFTQERARVEKKINAFSKKWTKNKSYLSDEKVLVRSLRQYEELIADEDGDASNEGYYLGLRSALESDNPELKAAHKKYSDFYTPLSNKLTFYPLSLGTIDKKLQKQFLKSELLAPYHFFLKNIFNTAKHDLSEEQENLSSLLYGPMAGNWDDMTNQFLSQATEIVLVEEKGKLQEKEMSFNQFLDLVNSPIQEVRDSAAVAANAVFERLGDVYEKEFNTFLERKQIFDKLRGYDRPDTYRHLADTIDTKTVDTMLSVVKKNLKLAQDYYKFKAKLMGKKQLAYHERNIPFGEVQETFTYTKSVEVVSRAFEKLDPEFHDAFRMFVEEGRVDVHPGKGKTGGAFCAGASKDTPTYILLNHSDDLGSLTTLAHESGHGIHNELMRPEQRPVYCGTSLATAEVASTFCEEFALREAVAGMDEEGQFVAMGESLNGHISSIVRQAVFYMFEQEIHEAYRKKGYLTKAEIGAIFSKHMKSYMGSGVSQDAGSENWWMYVGHFRRPFYVYSYASGEMISMALQNMIYDDPNNIEKVKNFLRSGQSDTSEKLFKQAGIDITKSQFWEQAFDQMRSDFKELKKTAKSLGKI